MCIHLWLREREFNAGIIIDIALDPPRKTVFGCQMVESLSLQARAGSGQKIETSARIVRMLYLCTLYK